MKEEKEMNDGVLEVFDRPMRCSSGVCGPEVEEETLATGTYPDRRVLARAVGQSETSEAGGPG